MPRTTPYFFETTVFEPTRGAEASLISVPAAVLQKAAPESAHLLGPPADLAELLGVQLGVQLQSSADLPEVFFASLAGRVVPFDQFSAERWRTQRLERASTPEAHVRGDRYAEARIAACVSATRGAAPASRKNAAAAAASRSASLWRPAEACCCARRNRASASWKRAPMTS
jgi:hypothetical protein